jgi:hypothetical protein
VWTARRSFVDVSAIQHSRVPAQLKASSTFSSAWSNFFKSAMQNENLHWIDVQEFLIRLQPRQKIIEISRRGADGQFETRTIIEEPNGSGAMQPFGISNTRGFRRGNH